MKPVSGNVKYFWCRSTRFTNLKVCTFLHDHYCSMSTVKNTCIKRAKLTSSIYLSSINWNPLPSCKRKNVTVFSLDDQCLKTWTRSMCKISWVRKGIIFALLRSCPNPVSSGSPTVHDNISSTVKALSSQCPVVNILTWFWRILFFFFFPSPCGCSFSVQPLSLPVGHYVHRSWYYRQMIFEKLA